ncbi:MAG: cupin domain-containing protein [Alphaproteobacteria bacterium]|nr:cupin domain-containing protein [Alphaproteobacteria bacterium]
MTELLTTGKFAVPVDPGGVERDWKRRGFSCQTFVDPPGRQWNGFVHQANELVTVVDGRLALIVAGERLVLGPGDEALIPREAVHSVHNIHAGTTRWLFGYD